MGGGFGALGDTDLRNHGRPPALSGSEPLWWKSFQAVNTPPAAYDETVATCSGSFIISTRGRSGTEQLSGGN